MRVYCQSVRVCLSQSVRVSTSFGTTTCLLPCACVIPSLLIPRTHAHPLSLCLSLFLARYVTHTASLLDSIY